jgi:hypothetical protein
MTDRPRDDRRHPRSEGVADPTRDIRLPPLPDRPLPVVPREWAVAGRPTDVADDDISPVPADQDGPTVTLAGPAPASPHRTLRFGAPRPVRVTVGPRPRPSRRYRTWPWIAAVVLALLVLGVVLLVLMLRGATIDADTDLVGSERHPPHAASASARPGSPI